MTVLSGRASPGARSVLRAVYGALLAIVGLVASGCGNTTFTYGTPVISFSTTPGPFTSYFVQVYQIALTRSDGTLVYPLTVPEMVDFTHLNDRTELFGAPAIIEGNYVSATITLNYSVAQIYVNVNGASQAVTVLDASTGVAAATISYTLKFDPAHPLVIKHGVSTPLDFNFDLSASSVLNTTTSPMQLSVRPVMTASTEPVYRKPMRARGEYVTADTGGSDFTINARAFFDLISSPKGAIQINTDSNTAYNINGVSFKGADGLAAMSKLAINTMIEVSGTLDTAALNSIKPVFTASEVYAGVSVSNGLTDRIIGTVASRSGNTLHIHGAVNAHPIIDYVTDEVLSFVNDLPVTIASTTVVAINGQPDFTSPSIGDISVGQQVDMEATTTFNTTGVPTSADASTGLIRLASTSAWGTLNADGTVNLISLGNYQPEAFTFTGTGSATGHDSDPTAYAITNSSTTNLSGVTTGTVPVRFDGMVTPFAAAQPDFTATTVTLGSDTDQVLVIDWINGGTTNPFVSAASDGLTVNMSDANLGTSHTIQTGPMYIIDKGITTVDLTSPLLNPKIVADPNITNQFAIGNGDSTTGLSVFQSYPSYLTQISTVLNGTNKIQKLVAVGKWDGATFTAYRIDMVQLP